MSNLFGIHIPFTGYGSQYRVGDTIPGAAASIPYSSPAGARALGGSGYGGAYGMPTGLAARLGLGGVDAAADAFRTTPKPKTTDAPSAPQPTGWNGAFGGVGSWIDQHRGALSDIGKTAAGALDAYGLITELQEQKRQRQHDRELEDRKRRDQEQAAQLVTPAYVNLLQGLLQRTGYGGASSTTGG